jgi:hypothetical protein
MEKNKLQKEILLQKEEIYPESFVRGGSLK